MFKKLLSLLCCASVFTLTACSGESKLTTPEDIDALMQENGYTLNTTSTAVSGDNGSFKILYLNSEGTKFYTISTDEFLLLYLYDKDGIASDSMYSQSNNECALNYNKNDIY